MPSTTHPELCSLITNVCKLPKDLNLPEGEQPFDLKSFYEFVILGGKMEPIVCLLFYLVKKMWDILYKKPYQTANSYRKQHQNVLMGTHKQKRILFQIFFGEYTLFLTLLLFWIGGMRSSNNWVEEEPSSWKIIRAKEERREKIQNLYRWWNFFILIYTSTYLVFIYIKHLHTALHYYLTNYYRKSYSGSWCSLII